VAAVNRVSARFESGEFTPPSEPVEKGGIFVGLPDAFGSRFQRSAGEQTGLPETTCRFL
jgi:hypothetical protein